MDLLLQLAPVNHSHSRYHLFDSLLGVFLQAAEAGLSGEQVEPWGFVGEQARTRMVVAGVDEHPRGEVGVDDGALEDVKGVDVVDKAAPVASVVLLHRCIVLVVVAISTPVLVVGCVGEERVRNGFDASLLTAEEVTSGSTETPVPGASHSPRKETLHWLDIVITLLFEHMSERSGKKTQKNDFHFDLIFLELDLE